MTSLRAVKNKINSVKSVKKIFSVMQLIAASKMKKAQDGGLTAQGLHPLERKAFETLLK